MKIRYRVGVIALVFFTALGIWLTQLGGIATIEDAYIAYKTRDKTDRSLLENKEQVRVILCGTGSPQLNSQRGQACTLVAAGGMLFLFDAGENAMRNIEAARVPIQSVTHTFITHFHSDHFNGLGALANHSWIYGRTEPFEVWGPPGMHRITKGFSEVYAQDVGFRSQHFVQNPEIASPRSHEVVVPTGQGMVRVFERDGVSIDAVLMKHPPVEPAYGYLLQYKGKRVFISGDTTTDDRYLSAMQNADLVVHEAHNSTLVQLGAAAMRRLGQHKFAYVAEHVGEYHADTMELARMAERAHVKHLVLTHMVPAPDSWFTRKLFAWGMSRVFRGDITVGEDGMDISL